MTRGIIGAGCASSGNESKDCMDATEFRLIMLGAVGKEMRRKGRYAGRCWNEDGGGSWDEDGSPSEGKSTVDGGALFTARR
jgi:hypothetical protein